MGLVKRFIFAVSCGAMVALAAGPPARADDDGCTRPGGQNCVALLATNVVVVQSTSTVPEPASFAIFAAGAAGLALVRRRRYSAAERANPSGTAK